MSDRFICERCHRVNRFRFLSPENVRIQVLGEKWCKRLICLACFAEAGDTRRVAWAEDLKIEPKPLVG